MITYRKPEFAPREDLADDFSRLVDAEVEVRRQKDPNVTYEDVLKAVARENPVLYELHSRRVAGDTSAYELPPANSPYFQKIADLLFTESKRLNPDARYADAVAACAEWYPELYRIHLSQKIGMSIPASRLHLSERENISTQMSESGLDRLRFARMAFPALVQNRWDELKLEDKGAKYEAALREVGAQVPELCRDHRLSLGA